jgi:DNA adenine methylase
MSRFCSPLRYPGGKNCIYNFVSEFFYENDLIGIDYAEPYAGGSGLALRLLFNEFVNEIHINDLDPAIHAFWKGVLNNPVELCDWIEDVQIDMENWFRYRGVHSLRNTEIEYLELAKATFFLNRTNVSGVLKGGVIGGAQQTGKYKMTARFNREELIQRILRISKFKSRINLTNLDGIRFIRKMNRSKENVFIYLDPPYFGKGADLYMNFYKDKDHLALAKEVAKINKKWMVSYDNHDFIVNLYENQNRIQYQLSQCASNRTGDEILIFKQELSFQSAMEKLNSPKIMESIYH